MERTSRCNTRRRNSHPSDSDRSKSRSQLDPDLTASSFLKHGRSIPCSTRHCYYHTRKPPNMETTTLDHNQTLSTTTQNTRSRRLSTSKETDDTGKKTNNSDTRSNGRDTRTRKTPKNRCQTCSTHPNSSNNTTETTRTNRNHRN